MEFLRRREVSLDAIDTVEADLEDVFVEMAGMNDSNRATMPD